MALAPFRLQNVFQRIIEVGWGQAFYLNIQIIVQNDEAFPQTGLAPYIEIEGYHGSGEKAEMLEVFTDPDDPPDPGLDRDPPVPTVPWPPDATSDVPGAQALATYFVWVPREATVEDVGGSEEAKRTDAIIYVNVHKIRGMFLEEDPENPVTEIVIRFNDTAALGTYFDADLYASYMKKTGEDTEDEIDGDSVEFGSAVYEEGEESGDPSPAYTITLNFETQQVTIEKTA
jgi:hypothetical protein